MEPWQTLNSTKEAAPTNRLIKDCKCCSTVGTNCSITSSPSVWKGLLNHIIAERLKRIVEQTNVLKPRHRLQKRLQCNVTGRSLARDEWCERCLLITESPKTPGHYRYLIWVLVSITYTRLAVFSFAICSCSCVYCDFEFLKFVFSTLPSRSCWQLTNSCSLRGLEGSSLWIDILCFLLPIGIFSKCLLGVKYA